MLPVNPSSATAPRPLTGPRIGWLVAIVLVAAVAVLLTLRLTRASAQPLPPRADAPAGERNASELANIKQALALLEQKSAALEHKSSTLEHKSSALEATVADQSASAKAAEPIDTRTDQEIHRAVLTELDVLLATDQGDHRDRRSAADAFNGQLSSAISGKARVVEIECATALCKAVIEEDTGAQPEMDTSTLVDSTPFLKREAMFGYEREGTRKRTVIYAARDGHSLAAARGVPMPSNAPKP
jgi:hypothetical protein